MIIVLVMDQFDTGHDGITVSGFRFAEYLRKNGHEVRVVSTGMEMPGKYVVPEYNIPIVTYKAHQQGSIIAKPVDGILRRAFSGADVVHFLSFWPIAHRGEKIAREMGIATTTAFHTQPENITYNIGLGHVEFVNRFIYKLLRRIFYKKFGNIHCPSEFIARELRKYGYKAKLHVISNGVGDDFVPMPVERPPEWDGKILILMVGRLSPEKRQDLLINAVHKSKYGDRIQLVLAGQGPNEHKYRKLAEKLANPPIIGFYSRPDLIKLMNSSDLYVHASDIEIEGISCLEAFSCGLVPVISDSPKSATNQYALTENNLFRHGDPDDLAAKLDHWLEHPEEKAVMSARYAKYAESLRVEYSVRKSEIMFKYAIARQKEGELKRTRFIYKSVLARTGQNLLINIAAPLLYVANKSFFGLHIRGRRNLKGLKGGLVTVSNHIHPMDCSMIALSLAPRRMYFTSLLENFSHPVTGFLVRNLGGIPIPKNVKELGPLMDVLGNEIRKGRPVHFYPEGSIEKYSDSLRPFKKGAFFLAVEENVPIVPIMITYRSPGRLARVFKKKPFVNVEIGKPIYPDRAAGNQRDKIQALMDLTYQNMLDMSHMDSKPKKKSKAQQRSEISA